MALRMLHGQGGLDITARPSLDATLGGELAKGFHDSLVTNLQTVSQAVDGHRFGGAG